MKVMIRPVKVEDSEAINEIRRMHGVMENMLAMKSERVDKTKKRTENIGEDEHLMVAEIDESGAKKVVALAGLHVNSSPRLRHSGSIGIGVHTDYQGIGIGKMIMNELLDIADNWLMLVRVELGVYTDNERAINLYKSLGFEIEGTKKYAAIRSGEYVDEYIMGRYRYGR